MQFTQYLPSLFSASALLFAVSVALAGRPLLTEDAAIPDAGVCEIEGALSRLRSQPGSHDASLKLGCGVSYSTQLALAGARGRSDGQALRGMELSGKSQLWQGEADPSGNAAGLTLAYALEDARDQERHRWRHASSLLNLVYSRPLNRDIQLHLNLAHVRDEQARLRSTRWALALEHAGWSPWAPMGEVYGDDRSAPWWNLGLRLELLPERLYLDAACGQQINAARARLWTAGFRLAF